MFGSAAFDSVGSSGNRLQQYRDDNPERLGEISVQSRLICPQRREARATLTTEKRRRRSSRRERDIHAEASCQRPRKPKPRRAPASFTLASRTAVTRVADVRSLGLKGTSRRLRDRFRRSRRSFYEINLSRLSRLPDVRGDTVTSS